MFYTPLWLGYGDPLASLPAMREWRPGRDSAGGGAAAGGFERIATPRRIYRPARSLEGTEQLTLHTITQCDVGGTRLECDATVVVGPFSRVFYVSPKAVYVWTAAEPPRRCSGCRSTAGRRPRSPSRGRRWISSRFWRVRTGTSTSWSSPRAPGDWMWTAERRRPPGADSLRLLRAPLARFDDGRARGPAGGVPQPLRRRSPALRQRERLVE